MKPFIRGTERYNGILRAGCTFSHSGIDPDGECENNYKWSCDHCPIVIERCTPTQYFYRYDSHTVDEYGTVRIYLRTFEVVRHTEKGVWLQSPNSWYPKPEKFVLLNAQKMYACPTKEEALVSFKARKEKYIRILKSRLQSAEDALRKAEHIKTEGE